MHRSPEYMRPCTSIHFPHGVFYSLVLELEHQHFESGQRCNRLTDLVFSHLVWNRVINGESDGDVARLSRNSVATEPRDELRVRGRFCKTRLVEVEVDVLDVVWSHQCESAR